MIAAWLRIPMVYTYLIAYQGAGTVSRSVRPVDKRLDNEVRIAAIEQLLARETGQIQVAVTNLVLLKRRIGRIPNPIRLAPPVPAAGEPAAAG